MCDKSTLPHRTAVLTGVRCQWASGPVDQWTRRRSLTLTRSLALTSKRSSAGWAAALKLPLSLKPPPALLSGFLAGRAGSCLVLCRSACSRSAEYSPAPPHHSKVQAPGVSCHSRCTPGAVAYRWQQCFLDMHWLESFQPGAQEHMWHLQHLVWTAEWELELHCGWQEVAPLSGAHDARPPALPASI